METNIKARQIVLHREMNKHTNKQTHTYSPQQKTNWTREFYRQMSLLTKTSFFFLSLPSEQVTASVYQVAGKKQRGTVCALCYLRLALQTKVLISQRYRSGSQWIPRLLRYPLSCRSSSSHVRNVRQMNLVHTLPRFLFKIQRNLYTLPLMPRSFKCSLPFSL
jgi:hypothetical protein